MKTNHHPSAAALSPLLILTFAWLAAQPARAREISAPQIQIEAKFVEISRSSIRDLGFEWIGDINTSVSRQLLQPRGSTPESLGTFPVNPPGNLPPTGDIRVFFSPEILRTLLESQDAQSISQPRVTLRSAQQATISVVRDVGLKLNVTPRVSDSRQIEMTVVPEVQEFDRFSVDVFGTVAFGRVEGSEQTTRDVTVNGKRVVVRQETVIVPFDNGQQIVNREEVRNIQTEESFSRTEQVSETRDFNRLGNVAGGGGVRFNYMFNPNFGANVRGEVLGGDETLGVVTASIFAEYPNRTAFTPTVSLGGGVLFPDAEAVMDAGVGVKIKVAPAFDLFTEAHLITNFGSTNVGEVLTGVRIPLGRKPVTTNVQVEDGQTTVIGGVMEEQRSRDRVPVLGRVPVIAHLFRAKSGLVEKRNLLIFVTPRITQAE